MSRKCNFAYIGLLIFPILVIFASFLFPTIMARQSKWFGINQISGIALPELVSVLLIACLFIFGCFLLLRNDRWRIVGGITILFTLFVFRSNTMNQDGQDLLWKIPADVNRVGAHVVHDEMLELCVHSLFWSTLNELGNFSVGLSYQILSASSGLVFMLLLFKYAKENINSNQLLFLVLVSSGGFIQLFFGDVENYSITASIVMWYFLVASRVFKGRSSAITAAVILGLAMCFHLEAGFLVPSLAYLLVKSSSEEKPCLHRFFPIMLIPFVLVLLCMLILNWLGILPLENLWLYSHASAHGGNIASIIPPLTVPYYLEILNLLILLFPSFLLIPFAIATVKLDRIDGFFITATGFLMLLPLAWRASLGVLNDWNLFAILAIPGSILVWSLLVQKADNRKYKYMLITLLAFSMLNTFSWVVKNHAG
jgi:hypothetical protein